jgi:hypothetical protein
MGKRRDPPSGDVVLLDDIQWKQKEGPSHRFAAVRRIGPANERHLA